MFEDYILKFRLIVSHEHSQILSFHKKFPVKFKFPKEVYLKICQTSMMIIFVGYLNIL